MIGVSTGLIGVLQVNEIVKIILRRGKILDGKFSAGSSIECNLENDEITFT